jgi:hypothetical protein
MECVIDDLGDIQSIINVPHHPSLRASLQSVGQRTRRKNLFATHKKIFD